MAAKQYKWLNISIFYSRPSWHLLLADGLEPFLKSSREEGLVNRFVIHFNEQRGEHLRIWFEVEKPFERPFLTRLSQFFEDYLQTCPSRPQEPKAPITNFIGDFPCNQVFYGLHRLQPLCGDPLSATTHCEQSYALSQMILEAFRETEIDAQNVETFYLYVGLSLLQSFNHASNPALVKSLEERFYHQADIRQNSISENVLQQFIPLLREMTTEIICAERTETEMRWLAVWQVLCKKQFNQPFGISFHDLAELVLQALDGIALQLNIPKRRFQLLTTVLIKSRIYESVSF
jgi:hypothetical protein